MRLTSERIQWIIDHGAVQSKVEEYCRNIRKYERIIDMQKKRIADSVADIVNLLSLPEVDCLNVMEELHIVNVRDYLDKQWTKQKDVIHIRLQAGVWKARMIPLSSKEEPMFLWVNDNCIYTPIIEKDGIHIWLLNPKMETEIQEIYADAD